MQLYQFQTTKLYNNQLAYEFILSNKNLCTNQMENENDSVSEQCENK